MADRLVPVGMVTVRPAPEELRRFRCPLCGGLDLGMPGPGGTCSRHPVGAVAEHARRGRRLSGAEALAVVEGQRQGS
jgi:hypothetical protein